jgi:formate dehydrogenase (coenzyme F420) beta subunit
MTDKTKALVQAFEKVFDELEVVLGWQAGYDTLHTTPAFIRQVSELEKLVWNPLCASNLSGYLAKTKNAVAARDGKKIGICVKGCDSRSVVALIQENFISRDRLYIVGIPCRGTIDVRRLGRQKPDLKEIQSLAVDGEDLRIETAGGTERVALKDVLARKCLQCRHPNPVIYDEQLDEPLPPRAVDDRAFPFVDKLERFSLEQRRAFWATAFDPCIRCYACRNACPLCVCQDGCIAETRRPGWLSARNGISEKFFFHMIHAFHLAGRCTGCGECERVCPMEIPVSLVKEKLNQVVGDVLGYEAGLDPEAKPPFLTFDPGELDGSHN